MRSNEPVFTEADEIVIGELAIELEDISRGIHCTAQTVNLEEDDKHKLLQQIQEISKKTLEQSLEDRLAIAGATLLVIAENYGADVKRIYQGAREGAIKRGLALPHDNDDYLLRGGDRWGTEWNWDD